jgi:hypothetical protein
MPTMAPARCRQSAITDHFRGASSQRTTPRHTSSLITTITPGSMHRYQSALPEMQFLQQHQTSPARLMISASIQDTSAQPAMPPTSHSVGSNPKIWLTTRSWNISAECYPTTPQLRAPPADSLQQASAASSSSQQQHSWCGQTPAIPARVTMVAHSSTMSLSQLVLSTMVVATRTRSRSPSRQARTTMMAPCGTMARSNWSRATMMVAPSSVTP